MAAWLTTAGLSLQFISLWLVTPQIIGEDRIGDYVEDLSEVIHRLHRAVDPYSRNSGPVVFRAVFIAAGMLAVTVVLTIYVLPLSLPYHFDGGIGSVVVNVLVLISMLVIACAITAILLTYISRPLVFLIADLVLIAARYIDLTAHSSHVYLLIGAFLFTAGFGMLLAAVWV
jgi:hypothetical protein